MIDILTIRWNQFVEAVRDRSFKEALRKAISKSIMANQTVVPAYKNLSMLKDTAKSDAASSLEFLIVNRENGDSAASMMRIASRRLKVAYNTRSGYYAYAVASQGEIIGDIWCATPREVKTDPIHPDLPWLGINCGKKDAYMYDMYVTPDSRGKVVTSFLLTNALKHLKSEGYEKAYGFYESDNLPALWTHRLFGYTELAKRKSVRFLLYKKTEPVT